MLIAATLEAGGDALARVAMHEYQGTARIALFVLSAAVLFAYGVTVNSPPWDFSRLLGVYVTLFFLVAQIVNFFAFGIRPGAPIPVGGALIIAGGVVITAWRT